MCKVTTASHRTNRNQRLDPFQVVMNPSPRIARCERSLSTRNCDLRRMIAMRQVRRATSGRPGSSDHRSPEIDIVDKLEKRALEMIGNMGLQSTTVNFLMGAFDPLSMEPCGLMREERGVQHGAQLAGWARHEVQPGLRCRCAALRGVPDRHESQNHLHLSGPGSRLDARVSERHGMRACCDLLLPHDGMGVACPRWGGHR